MTTDERLAQLEAKVAELRRLRQADDEIRGTAVDALKAVSTRLGHLQDRVAAVPHPALTAARDEAAPALFARLSARLGAAEEWLRELSRLMLEDHDILHEIVEMLRSGNGPRAA